MKRRGTREGKENNKSRLIFFHLGGISLGLWTPWSLKGHQRKEEKGNRKKGRKEGKEKEGKKGDKRKKRER